MATIQHAGWVFKDDGTAVSGATVQLYEQGSTSSLVTLQEGGTSVTTASSGYWSATTTAEPDSTGSYYGHDVKITSGSSIRYRRGLDRMQVAEVDIRNATGATQGGLLVANNANTASNKVATFANRRKTGVDGDEIYISFEMMNDADEIHEFARITAEAVDSANGNEDGQLRFGISDGDAGTPGPIVDVLTLNTTVGGVTSVITDTISQYNNTITVGVDDTGYDVKFFGASAGAYMLYDESADQLVIMGKSADAVDSTGKLLLATSLTDVNANDVLGKIEFKAAHEAGGGDSTTVAAAVEAVAQGTFSSSVNATDIIFKTGHSEAATEKFRFTSQGEIGIGGATYGSSGDVLTSGGAGAAPTWSTPTTGDITGVTAGTGLSGGGTAGTVTVNLALTGLTDTAIANGDYIVFTDTTDSNATVKGDLADVATLFAGTGLTASSSVIGVDASQTQITAVGTLGSLTVGGVVDITDATDSSDATGDTGALRTEGGASIAKKLYVGTDLDVDGTAELDNITIGGAQGSDGQVLTSTGSAVAWEDAAGGISTGKALAFSLIF